MILGVEDGVPLRLIDYNLWNTALMRYAYTRKVNQRIFPFITEEIGMHFPFDKPESPQYRLIYNEVLLNPNGEFVVERLQLLGLMRCKHPSVM